MYNIKMATPHGTKRDFGGTMKAFTYKFAWIVLTFKQNSKARLRKVVISMMTREQKYKTCCVITRNIFGAKKP